MEPLQDFSSWQPEQERHFVVFEQRSLETSKRAWAVGLVAGAAFGVAVLVIAVAFKPTESRSQAAARENPDLASENVAPSAAIAPVTAPSASTETAPAAPTETAPAPAGTPAATPADPAAGSAPPADSPAASGSSAAPASSPASGTTATPPAPPPGTTKAPPTDLVK